MKKWIYIKKIPDEMNTKCHKCCFFQPNSCNKRNKIIDKFNIDCNRDEIIFKKIKEKIIMKKFVFDIDDTILFSRIDKNGNYHLKNFDPFMIKKINKLYNEGNEIILWTGRHWNHLVKTTKQLESIEIKYHTLLMGKPVADHYIDDKAMHPMEFMNKEF